MFSRPVKTVRDSFDLLDDMAAGVRVATVADGPLTMFDTGHVVTNHGHSTGRVEAGRWVHNSPDYLGPAAYAQIALGRPVRRLGCTADFGAGRRAGTVALVIPSEPWSDERRGERVADMHFVLAGSGRWNVSRYADSRVGPTYASGRVRLRQGPIPVAVGLADDGSASVSIAGQVMTFRCRRPEDAGEWAIFELFENGPRERSAAILEMWAN